MPNLMEQLRSARGFWPELLEYKRENGRHVVTKTAPNGAVLCITNRSSERMAEMEVAAKFQNLLDAAFPKVDGQALLNAERLHLSILRECRLFHRDGGQIDVNLYGLRRSIMDAQGSVLLYPTDSAHEIEKAIALADGKTAGAWDLLEKKGKPGKTDEPRTTTTPRG